MPKRLLEQSSPRFDNAEVLEEEELLAHPELAASSSLPEAPDDAPPAPKRDSQMDLFDQIIDEWVVSVRDLMWDGWCYTVAQAFERLPRICQTG